MSYIWSRPRARYTPRLPPVWFLHTWYIKTIMFEYSTFGEAYAIPNNNHQDLYNHDIP